MLKLFESVLVLKLEDYDEIIKLEKISLKNS